MRVLIQGSGIGGCATAIGLSKLGYDVTVVEKRKELFTDGAGILLYSNALKFLDKLGVLPQVLTQGDRMSGDTKFYDMHSNFLGTVNYKPIDPHYDAYVGINRTSLLTILYNDAVTNNVKFVFDATIELDSLTGSTNDTIRLSNGTESKFDLVVACDGTNSPIRRKLIKDSESKYTGYGLWHSLHKRRPEIDEKVTVIGEGCRMGIIPLSKDYMYIWASLIEPEKIYIDKKDQPRVMREKFSCFTGLMGDIINELDDDSYVHFTAVEEVHLEKPWYVGNVVFLGDSAHASLPFMAQGGAQALHDCVSLCQILSKEQPLNISLNEYSNFRYDIAKTVQRTSNLIGSGYQSTNVDLEKTQKGLDLFYTNKQNFILPEEL